VEIAWKFARVLSNWIRTFLMGRVRSRMFLSCRDPNNLVTIPYILQLLRADGIYCYPSTLQICINKDGARKIRVGKVSLDKGGTPEGRMPEERIR